MVVVGGRRTRLITIAFHAMITDSLDALGWFNTGRDHQPLSIIVRPNDWDETVGFNSLAITIEDAFDNEAEMGSLLTEDRWTFTIDVYAEDDAVGIHLINDVKDILRGKMPSIGRGGPIFPVADITVGPDPIFHCDIERVVVDRARGFTKAWQQHWWACRCDVVDTYGDENYA